MSWLLLSDDELRARLIQRGELEHNADTLVASRDHPRIADHISRLLNEDDDQQDELFDAPPTRPVDNVDTGGRL